jgi:hypothetical protein
MEKIQSTTEQSSSLLLTGTILMANIPYNDYIDYAIKAIIGGAIWLGFKLTADVIASRKKKD